MFMLARPVARRAGNENNLFGFPLIGYKQATGILFGAERAGSSRSGLGGIAHTESVGTNFIDAEQGLALIRTVAGTDIHLLRLLARIYFDIPRMVTFLIVEDI